MSKKAKYIEKYEKGDTVVLHNVEVQWAWLDPSRPDTKFEPCWRIDAILDDETADQMRSDGFKVVTDDEGRNIFRLKRKVKTRLGNTQKPPRVVGRDPNVPFTEIVGNGSICNIEAYAKYQKSPGGEVGLQAYLNAVQVVEHKPYGGSVFEDLTKTEAEKPF